MLGQKIVDCFSDIEEETEDSQCLLEPPTSLSIRRIKSAGLRIVTEDDALWPDSPRGRTNSLCPPSHRQSYISIRTPDTSHTFGRPNPTMLSPKHPPSALPFTPASASSAPPTAMLSARRRSRYSKAESALRSAVETSSAEVSPQELQIRVLEQATALLSEQAKDAQVCAAKLRACLSVKNQVGLSPEEVKSLQRECWLEQRRSSARQGQSAVTRDLVTKLCSPISEAPPPLLMDSPAPMSQHEANLAKFMQLSPTRITFPSHSRSASASPTVVVRRQTISQVRPMRLRASALELALRSPIQARRRSKSLDGSHSRRNSDSTDATCVEDISLPLSSNTLQLKVPPSPLLPGPDGSICINIEKMEAHCDRSAIVAEMGDVSLPDYAVDLLEGLVSSSLDVTLPALAPSPSAQDSQSRTRTRMQSPDALAPRKSSSVPEFALTIPAFDHDLGLGLGSDLPHASPSPPSSPPQPPSRAMSPLSRPSSPLSGRAMSPPPEIIGRLRSHTDTPLGASPFPPVRLRPATSNAHLRAGVTQSLHAPFPATLGSGSGSLSKASGMRLTSPSLVAVPESEAGFSAESQSLHPAEDGSRARPQTSMSGYADTVLGEEGEGEGEGAKEHALKRVFSITSFRKRRGRFGSQGSLAADGGRPAEAGAGGILARFRRRFNSLRY